MNSKRKGSAGERELLRVLQDAGLEAVRNDQRYTGGLENPDVALSAGGREYHIEVKRSERFRLYDAMDQARADCGHRVPVVLHRSNRRPWVAVLLLPDFLALAQNPTVSPSGNRKPET